VRDLFAALDGQPDLADVEVSCAFFEIYGPKCQDLLNGRRKLAVSPCTNHRHSRMVLSACCPHTVEAQRSSTTWGPCSPVALVSWRYL